MGHLYVSPRLLDFLLRFLADTGKESACPHLRPCGNQGASSKAGPASEGCKGETGYVAHGPNAAKNTTRILRLVHALGKPAKGLLVLTMLPRLSYRVVRPPRGR